MGTVSKKRGKKTDTTTLSRFLNNNSKTYYRCELYALRRYL